MEPSFDSHHIDLPSIVSKPQVNLRKSKTGVQIFLDCKVESQDNIGSSDGESTLPELPAIQVAPKSLNSRVKDDKHHSSPHHKHQIEVKTKDNDEGGLPQIDSHERNLPPIENKTDRSNGKKRKPLYMRMIAEAAKALHHQLEKKVERALIHILSLSSSFFIHSFVFHLPKCSCPLQSDSIANKSPRD